jgi:predicted nucleic acid-binding protein
LIAFDTNVLVYAIQECHSDDRREIAKELVKKVGLVGGVVPVQVLGEFLNVCKRKLKVAPFDAIGQVQDYLEIFDCPQSQVDDLTAAALTAEQSNLQYFDALIITVAARAGATMLLSEDMQDGLEAAGLRVVNPFVAGNAGVISASLGSSS